jgi:adenine/guanine phosphoribosyltransferase-like PRPP-binding protein
MDRFSAGLLRLDQEVVQINKVFHTGADPMQRLIARPQFTGQVEPGSAYVLVDDVTTMGGTLADLADYLRSRSASVLGAVVLASAGRTGRLDPSPSTIKLLQHRHGAAIRDILGIETEALTADEAR